jgi:hypothetical protein
MGSMQRFWNRGRIAVAAAGLGFVGVLGLAAVFQSDIEAWYHLERLKRDPGYFTAIAGEPEGSPERVACERFMASAAGKLTLLRAVAAGLNRLPTTASSNYSLWLDRSTTSVIVSLRSVEGTVRNDHLEVHDIHEIFGQDPWEVLGWLPALGHGDHVLPEDPATAYAISNDKGRIGIHVRTDVPAAITPPPGSPPATPPSPPSTDTSAG